MKSPNNDRGQKERQGSKESLKMILFYILIWCHSRAAKQSQKWFSSLAASSVDPDMMIILCGHASC